MNKTKFSIDASTIKYRHHDKGVAFTADVLMLGKKVGYAKDSGHGHGAYYYAIDRHATDKKFQWAVDNCGMEKDQNFITQLIHDAIGVT